MGSPQELETVRFNSEPKRYKSVSLPKRSVLTLVSLGCGVVTEKLRFPYQTHGYFVPGNRRLFQFAFLLLHRKMENEMGTCAMLHRNNQF
jgi:hypothetical protein